MAGRSTSDRRSLVAKKIFAIDTTGLIQGISSAKGAVRIAQPRIGTMAQVRADDPPRPPRERAADEVVETGSPLVKQAVEALRKKILSTSGGETFLGCEQELIESLQVSRPTFRQAARLLEHEMLLRIKRGLGGGFFAQPPSARAVSRSAAIFLNSRGTTLAQIASATALLLEEASFLLATADQAARRRLAEHQRQHAGFENDPDERRRIRVILDFEILIGDLCGNPAVSLVLSVMRDLIRDARHGDFRMTCAMARTHADFHRRLVVAVQSGDSEMARLLARRHAQKIRRWNAPDDEKIT